MCVFVCIWVRIIVAKCWYTHTGPLTANKRVSNCDRDSLEPRKLTSLSFATLILLLALKNHYPFISTNTPTHCQPICVLQSAEVAFNCIIVSWQKLTKVGGLHLKCNPLTNHQLSAYNQVFVKWNTKEVKFTNTQNFPLSFFKIFWNFQHENSFICA